MRREERHHLKENPVARAVVQLQNALASGSRVILAGVALLIVILVGVGAYAVWQTQQADRAGALLADALETLRAEVEPTRADATDDGNSEAPPAGSFPSETAKLEAAVVQLEAVADAYPDQAGGVIARYELAAALVRLGRIDDAATHYALVIEADPDGLHGSMARLGLAETHVLSGDYESAVELLQPETEAENSAAPVDALLMRIGRAHELAGQHELALEAFNRVVEEFPFSVYFPQARQKIDRLESAAAGPSDGPDGS